MIRLACDCEKCLHKKVCKNKDNAKNAMARLSEHVYGTEQPGYATTWEEVMNEQNIDITFSCPDYDTRMGDIR